MYYKLMFIQLTFIPLNSNSQKGGPPLIPISVVHTVPVDRKRAICIVSRDLYNILSILFYPIFHCGLYCRGVSVTDNLRTKKGKSSIFGPRIRGLGSGVGYNGAHTVCTLYNHMRDNQTVSNL